MMMAAESCDTRTTTRNLFICSRKNRVCETWGISGWSVEQEVISPRMTAYPSD